MEIVQETRDNAVILKLQRRIDSATAKAFEERLMPVVNGAEAAVILDFQDLDYISSAGLRVILMAAKAAKARQRKLLLCGMKPNIHEVFAVSGFTKILTIVESCEAALAAA